MARLPHLHINQFFDKEEYVLPTPSRSVLIYVSGPITATEKRPDIKHNISRMNEVSLSLFLKGYSVICPVTTWFTDPGKYGKEWSDIMEVDLEILSRCDIMYMVRGWKDSKGSVIEWQYAQRQKIQIAYEPLTLEDIHERQESG